MVFVLGWRYVVVVGLTGSFSLQYHLHKIVEWL